MKSSSLEFLLPIYMPKPLYKWPALDIPIWKEGVSTSEKCAQGVGSAYSVSVILVHGGKLWNSESEREESSRSLILPFEIYLLIVNCFCILSSWRPEFPNFKTIDILDLIILCLCIVGCYQQPWLLSLDASVTIKMPSREAKLVPIENHEFIPKSKLVSDFYWHPPAGW